MKVIEAISCASLHETEHSILNRLDERAGRIINQFPAKFAFAFKATQYLEHRPEYLQKYLNLDYLNLLERIPD